MLHLHQASYPFEKTEEIWKDIEGFKGLYKVSNYGEIWTCLYCKKMKKRISKGYFLINLNKNGVQKTFSVHRIVAKTFIENPMNKKEVNHLDENKLNNHVNNLLWVTSKENSNWGTRNKRISQYVKENPVTFSNGQRGKAIYKLDSVTEEVVCKYNSVKEALEMLGSNPKTGSLSYCLTGNGINKTYKGYKWKYAE